MFRILASGCLTALLLLLCSTAWAEEPTPPASAPAPSTPPVTTMTPEQGGTLLGEYYAGKLSADTIDRVLEPGRFREYRSPWQGNVRLRFRFRNTTEDGTTDDYDFSAYLKVKYRDEGLPGWSGSFFGRATLDAGYFKNTYGYYGHDSITDTYAHRLNGRIYHAYANLFRPNRFVERLQIGRIQVDVGEYLRFDGARAVTRTFGRQQWQFAVFGGVPAYIYADSPDGDWEVGGQITGKPWKNGDVELDYTYIHNDKIYGPLGDGLLNFTVNQRFGQSSLVRLTYQNLDENPRLLRLTLDSLIPKPDVTIRAYFNTMLTSQSETVYDFDYYYWVTLALEPYWMGNISVSKGIGDLFSVEVGASGRQLYHASDEGRYNREFGEYFVTLASYDWLVDNLDMSISGEWWNSDDDIWTMTFDVNWKPSRCWRFSVGTDYAAYRYDMYADIERERVFGGYARASWRPTKRWRFDLRLRVDDDTYGTWTTLDAGVQYDF